ncbi:MAG: TetR/AcrR family transcriptional regulator [Bacillota bacterium]
MKKKQPETRIDQILKAAAKVFISRGYRRTTMADIAREMGVAPGTVYLYVESKEALFHLLAMRTLVNPPAALPELPVPTPPPGATIAMLRQAMSLEEYMPRLAAVLAGRPSAQKIDDLEVVIGELYDKAYAHRVGINLIENSAIDWPDMADVFFGGLRRQLIAALMQYIELGIAAGEIRAVPDVDVAARFVLETVAWFAIHRHGDPGTKDFSDEAAREGVIDLVAASLRRSPAKTTGPGKTAGPGKAAARSTGAEK